MPLLLFALLLILLGVYLINDNIYLSCIGFLLISWLFMQRHYNDPYGLFHLSLNKLPFEDPNSPGSIGVIGRMQKHFRKALALNLISAADLKEGDTILDVGHGTGESLLLLLSDPSIPRPSYLIGITSLDIHHH